MYRVDSKILQAAAWIFLGLFVTCGVISDWENCHVPESKCYFFLLIPSLIPIFLVTHLISWIGFQLYKYN